MKKKGTDKQLWTDFSCINCILNITYQAILKSTSNIKIQFECLKNLFKILNNFSEDTFPTEISTQIFRMLQVTTNNKDPFKIEKKKSNLLGIKVSKLIKADIINTKNTPDRIYKALIGSLVGNIIDYGTDKHNFSLDPEEFMSLYSKNLEIGFKINEFNKFLTLLEGVGTIMYVLDNAGEIAFDKLLIEELLKLKKRVIVVLKEGTISNDATLKDAYEIKLNKIDIELITTGSNALGVMIDEFSENFLKKLAESDLIIAKGQANWETFTYYKDFFKIPIFLILRTKCKPISNFIGAEIGDNIITFIE